VKKSINNLAFSINYYAYSSFEINFYYESLNQKKSLVKDITNFLRCRKIIKEFYPSKQFMDEITIPLGK